MQKGFIFKMITKMYLGFKSTRLINYTTMAVALYPIYNSEFDVFGSHKIFDNTALQREKEKKHQSVISPQRNGTQSYGSE